MAVLILTVVIVAVLPIQDFVAVVKLIALVTHMVRRGMPFRRGSSFGCGLSDCLGPT